MAPRKVKSESEEGTLIEDYYSTLASGPEENKKRERISPRSVPASPKRWSWKKILAIAAILIFVGLSGTTAFFYREWKKAKTDPKVLNQQEAREIAGKIGEHLVLPQGEEPSLATVTDAQKLKVQPFFTNAQNGDKVLIYPNAQKVILYRPSEDKIIEFINTSAPLDMGGNSE